MVKDMPVGPSSTRSPRLLLFKLKTAAATQPEATIKATMPYTKFWPKAVSGRAGRGIMVVVVFTFISMFSVSPASASENARKSVASFAATSTARNTQAHMAAVNFMAVGRKGNALVLEAGDAPATLFK